MAKTTAKAKTKNIVKAKPQAKTKSAKTVKPKVKAAVKLKVTKSPARRKSAVAAKKVQPKVKTKAKAAVKNAKGSYTLHMGDQLKWLHSQAKERGMLTSIFVKRAIAFYLENQPKANTEAA